MRGRGKYRSLLRLPLPRRELLSRLPPLSKIPVTGVFLAWWLLDEPVTVKILHALLFITAQMVVLYLDPKRRFLQFPFNKGL